MTSKPDKYVCDEGRERKNTELHFFFKSGRTRHEHCTLTLPKKPSLSQLVCVFVRTAVISGRATVVAQHTTAMSTSNRMQMTPARKGCGARDTHRERREAPYRFAGISSLAGLLEAISKALGACHMITRQLPRNRVRILRRKGRVANRAAIHGR